ncbi:glutamate--tRNA ligase [Candidatus Falkowbacteria bacterium CG10_big_fil_rev_8_21_14_0_10_39_11]|uniref:Glutamate--tRNA ligase n=1 Tax=Candidatus Falkowbacteria bacterium CG10_big_fil_rev_8_21_14_0_10_39_11 TaxID=1974565 RepID=A0A2H0V655_9BACT|nr:MAG: glutamate--tRNA ligase [Candidatus Falkowbacteria bacterium CG10_big_fil_rev_8_21_14_0_10_39_11]
MSSKTPTNVRVRIAPSPTGFVHVGNLRTILYNYLFARHNDGTFIVRIEDTDRTRYVDGALEDLLKTLEWADFSYDEGPFIVDGKIIQKGDYGPYIQSERLDIYTKHIQTLLDKNKAYYCFCSKERINELREQQKKDKLPPKYDGLCRHLSKEEIHKKLTYNESRVIRFKMPEDKEVVFDDEIRGTIKVNTKDLDDFVLIKADQFPTYHFANIVDDHLMKITHVMRGDEWISSTPKHVMLYDAFDWQPPRFAHLPQILNQSKKKMSKRDGDVSVKDFIKSGYIKNALINFIALLGWNAGTEQEIYTVDEMIKQFSLDNVHKKGAIFDLEKLDWINGMYLRELSDENFATECLPFLIEAKLISPKSENQYINNLTNKEISFNDIKNYCSLEKNRIKKTNEISDAIQFVFPSKLNFDSQTLIFKKSDHKTTLQALQYILETIHSVPNEDFSAENIEKEIKKIIEDNNLQNGDVLWPMRVALSGQEKSPGPFEIAHVLGKDRTTQRLKEAILELSKK